MFFWILALGLAFCASAATGAFRALRGHGPVLRLVGALGAAWTAGLCVYAAGIGLLLVGLSEPWPFSLKQGPDTDYARERFEFHFQEPVPESIGNLYCRDEWGFGGDSIATFSFTFRDPAVIERLVSQLGLERVPEAEIGSLRYLAAPDWWPSQAALKNSNEAYQRSGVDFFWVDRETGRAYFQRANF